VVKKAPRGWTPVYKGYTITGLDEAVIKYAARGERTVAGR
jgi:hypothetical protein